VSVESDGRKGDLSSSAWYVEQNSTSDGGERSSGESDWSRSNNVDNPLGVEVAVIQEEVVSLVEYTVEYIDAVSGSSGISAVKLESSVNDRWDYIRRGSSQSV